VCNYWVFIHFLLLCSLPWLLPSLAGQSLQLGDPSSGDYMARKGEVGGGKGKRKAGGKGGRPGSEKEREEGRMDIFWRLWALHHNEKYQNCRYIIKKILYYGAHVLHSLYYEFLRKAKHYKKQCLLTLFSSKG